jgi:uncharacterized protein
LKRTLLVVAKAPVPGRAKTRLVPPLTIEAAAALQEALLLDTVETCAREIDDVRLLHASADEAAALRCLVPGVALERQEGQGLADALRLGVRRHTRAGAAAFVSSDIPGVPAGSITAAFAALDDGADVVLGPALDGGYWLVAMRANHEAVFRGIPWSTPAVLATTLEQCRASDLRVALVERCRDIDTSADLAALAAGIDRARSRHTAAMLDALAVSPVETAPPQLALESSRLISTSPWRSVIADQLLRGDGRRTGYTYLAVPRAVFVVPVTTADEVVFVRQYRHPVRDFTLEVPAGSVNDGESPLQAAERELREETGGRSAAWRHLTTFFSASAHLSLRSDAFLATGVILDAPQPDDEEEMTILRVPVATAMAEARAGRIAEGQTALALLLAQPFLATPP